MSSTSTSFTARLKGMLQVWSKHIIPVVVVALAFGMLQKPLLTLLSFIESTCLAHLSPDWFGGLVFFLACYLLKREWDYRKIYVPRPVSLWLILSLGIYLYYRHWEGSFSFWPIPCLGKLTWSDLLLIPWGGAVAIALRSRAKEDYWAIGIILATLCALFYFVLSTQGSPSLGRPLGSIAIAVEACLLMDFILFRRDSRPQPNSKEEASKEAVLSSQAIDPDDAIESEGDDWLGFSTMTRIVCENLQALDLSKGALTVGILAPWGRGKSSFINLLRKRLEKDGGIIIPFNPRGSKSVSSIPEDFFDVFAKELSRHYLGFSLLLARYTKHIGLLNQYTWTRPLGSLLTLLLPGKEQEAVNRTLRELGKRVYVLLDDLDRLSAEEILEVLKLMDRNASFTNTVFITAYDKDYVNNVLKKHLDHGLNHSFIDKYISWEIPLPVPDKEMLKRLMRIVLPMKAKDYYPVVYEEFQRAWKEVDSVVIEALSTVRDLKRYLNLMIPRYNEMKSVVHPEECFLLYVLCYKDLGVYSALNSGRLLQLDVPSQTYVLAPNYEEELGLLSHWEGTKGILERLFPSRGGESSERVAPFSLCQKALFDIYFGYLKSEESMPYADIMYRIVGSRYAEDPHKDVDAMIEEFGEDSVVKAFLFLIYLPKRIDEDRSGTIKLMAYIAFSDSLSEEWEYVLRYELREFFSQDRYEDYKKLGVASDVMVYKEMLKPMLSFVRDTQPMWLLDHVNQTALIEDVLSKTWGMSSQTCVYTDKEISDILLECQRAYYEQWKPTDGISGIRDFVLPQIHRGGLYASQATQALVSLVKRYPDDCVWLVLSWSAACFPDRVAYFEISVNGDLLALLEEQGFPLDVWLGLIEDPKIRYILNYAGSALKEGSARHITPLPDDETDRHSFDYIYRAILAQEERDRQRASSEG